QLEVPLGQALDAGGVIELRPLGAQRRDLIAGAAQVDGELGDALRLLRRVELDLVDIDRRAHEQADDDEVQESHAVTSPAARRRATASVARPADPPRRRARRCARRRAAWRSARADWPRPRRRRARPGAW